MKSIQGKEYAYFERKILEQMTTEELIQELKSRGIKKKGYMNIEMIGGTIEKVNYSDCTFHNVELNGTELTGVVFENCNFHNANFASKLMNGVVFNHAKLVNSWRDEKFDFKTKGKTNESTN